MGYSLGPVALGFANSFLGRRQVMFWFGIPVVLSYAAIGFSQDKVLIYLGNFMVGFLQSMPFGIVGKSVSFKRLHCDFLIHHFVLLRSIHLRDSSRVAKKHPQLDSNRHGGIWFSVRPRPGIPHELEDHSVHFGCSLVCHQRQHTAPARNPLLSRRKEEKQRRENFVALLQGTREAIQ